jgi:hypothetical protein
MNLILDEQHPQAFDHTPYCCVLFDLAGTDTTFVLLLLVEFPLESH